MSQLETIVEKAGEILANQLVVELIDQRPSNYRIDTHDNASEEEKTARTAPSALKLLNHSHIVVYEKDPKTKKEGWRMVKTRYIKGCDLFREDEQKAAGFEPNPQADTIWLTNGKLIIQDTPETRAMYNYITKGFNGNIDLDTDNGKVRRPDNAPTQIRIINTTKNANVDVNKFELEDKAIGYVNSLKTVDAGGVTRYNGDALEFLATLFKLGAFADGYASAEAWVAVRETAKANPQLFLTTIAGKRSLIESEVNKAIGKGVILISSDKAVLGSSNKLLVGFDSNAKLSDRDRVELVIDFLSNPDKANFLDQVRIGNHGAEVADNSILE